MSMRWGGDNFPEVMRKCWAEYRRYKRDPEAFRKEIEDSNSNRILEFLARAFLVFVIVAAIGAFIQQHQALIHRIF